MSLNKPQVVIVGGGFGGLHAAFALAEVPVQVTLIDRRNFHLFQPLLYQVATGGLSPANIAAPLRALLRRQKNVRVLLGEVVGVDLARRTVRLADGELSYDWLILAAGVRHHYFGRPDWEEYAPGLKTIEDATAIRSRVLSAFEQAEKTSDPALQSILMTFVVVGGGPTGVELAGALAELARHTLRREFRAIDPSQAQIILVEGTDRVLPSYPPVLSRKAEASLRRLGVMPRTNTTIIDVQPGRVLLRTATGVEALAAHTILWAAGIQGTGLARQLAEHAGIELDAAGRVCVAADCSLPGHAEVFVIGDMAHFPLADGRPAPALAPVAIQQGDYVARRIRDRLRRQSAGPPFRYRDRGTMATIGRAAAVVDLGWLRFSGFFAWLVWLFVHLMSIVEFQNRLLVLLQWAWNYVTRNRSARLITDPPTHKWPSASTP